MKKQINKIHRGINSAGLALSDIYKTEAFRALGDPSETEIREVLADIRHHLKYAQKWTNVLSHMMGYTKED